MKRLNEERRQLLQPSRMETAVASILDSGYLVDVVSDSISTVKTHTLKTWPEYFHAVKYGFKNFEVRRDDRDFSEGDYLKLKEWNPEEETYTGDDLTRRVVYILKGGEFGIEKGFVVMGLSMQLKK